MFIKLRKTAFLLATCLIYFNADAQSDTSYYDLGRIRIKKEFAQSVTIKGGDLEKFPATNLSDAIATWVSGVYTPANGVTYVIDGDLINDVNAYSIFDIKTVTLIENATTMLNGATQQQNLIIITTRKDHDGKSGFNVAGQSNLINLRSDNSPSTYKATYYHQYYVSAYKTVGDMHFGISADYQHDAIAAPSIISSNSIGSKTIKLDRFKLYGFFDSKIGNSSLLNIGINYVPETQNMNFTYNGFNPTLTQVETDDIKPALLNTKVSLSSKLLGTLSNLVSFNYNNTSGDQNSALTGIQTGNNYDENLVANWSTHNFLIRDNLQYLLTAGDWTIEPSMNLSFRFSKQNLSETNRANFSSGGPIIQQNNSHQEYKVYLLTPSLNVSYKNIFNIQGGLVANLSTVNGDQKTSPFVMASVDVLRLSNEPESYSWKLFGSYSNSGNYYDNNATLLDFNNYQTIAPSYYSNGGVNLAFQSVNHSFHNFQAGTVVGFFSNKLSVNYNFEKRQYISLVNIVTSNSNAYVYPLFNSQLHRVGVTANIIDNSKLKWFTTVNANRVDYNYAFNLYPLGTVASSSYNKEWTGGWVNQLQIGKLSFGADMLYLINKASGFTYSYSPYGYSNSFVLQNAYISYHIKTKAVKALEVYANTRNLVQNSGSTITDNRKFYGLGFKAGF